MLWTTKNANTSPSQHNPVGRDCCASAPNFLILILYLGPIQKPFRTWIVHFFIVKPPSIRCFWLRNKLTSEHHFYKKAAQSFTQLHPHTLPLGGYRDRSTNLLYCPLGSLGIWDCNWLGHPDDEPRQLRYRSAPFNQMGHSIQNRLLSKPLGDTKKLSKHFPASQGRLVHQCRLRTDILYVRLHPHIYF